MAVFGTKANPRATTVVPEPEVSELKYKFLTTTAATATVVAAVPGKSILVLGYTLNSTVAGTVDLQDDAATPVEHVKVGMAANGRAEYAGSASAPAFKVAKGKALDVANSGTTPTTNVHVTYVEV